MSLWFRGFKVLGKFLVKRLRSVGLARRHQYGQLQRWPGVTIRVYIFTQTIQLVMLMAVSLRTTILESSSYTWALSEG